MKYLLDTNVLIAMFKNQHGIRKSIVEMGFENCLVSEITLAELFVGLYKGNCDKQCKEVDFVKENFFILPITSALELYGKTRAELELHGQKIDSKDCLIGCSALAENLTVVTHNTNHFSRIPNLKVVDWETC